MKIKKEERVCVIYYISFFSILFKTKNLINKYIQVSNTTLMVLYHFEFPLRLLNSSIIIYLIGIDSDPLTI